MIKIIYINTRLLVDNNENMFLITVNVAIIVFAIIIIVSVIIAWYMKSYAYYDKGSFHIFIAVLTGLGVFVTFMFYLGIVQVQEQEQMLATVQEISRVNQIVLDSFLDEIKQASLIIPNFVLSITPLTNTLVTNDICISNNQTDPINAQTITAKLVLSYRIFDLWQDVITSDASIHSEPISYIANFLQRANSSELYQQWGINKLNFFDKTQKFGDLLFEYGLPIINQTSEEYVSVAEKLILDPRYILLI